VTIDGYGMADLRSEPVVVSVPSLAEDGAASLLVIVTLIRARKLTPDRAPARQEQQHATAS
jgi:hypothetical protein